MTEQDNLENSTPSDGAENQDLNQDQTQDKNSDYFKSENDPTKIHINKNPGEIISGTVAFLKSVVSLRDGTYDVKGVLENVREGIVFSGYNVWILMFSIIIASVGLNVDSDAVIIGAMLISPLMGPIRGIGFGVGVNDFGLLISSLKNFGITVGISLFTSILYFSVTPIHDLTANIFARTEPTFLDVIIAFAGGMAGVIAQSKKKADTVIPGVAIATALMPPLCTAGYGIANGEWSYFLGAIYLFILNSILIAASTYIFIRYLKFPKKEYVDPKVEKRVKGYTLAFVIIVVAPSIYMFYRMTKKSIFEQNAVTFIEQVVLPTNDNIVVEPHYYYDGKDSKITLDVSNYYADETVVKSWKSKLDDFDLEGVQLTIKQGIDIHSTISEALENYDSSQRGANTLASLLSESNNKVVELQKKLDYLKGHPEPKPDPLQMDHLLAGFKVDYPEYKKVLINRNFELNKKNQIDTVYALTVEFNSNIAEENKPAINSKISRRFKLELSQKLNVKQDSIPVFDVAKQ
ncbi:DUF389 domain-containing protein [Paracrocinitomix mangrovi]|uniref:DUF389 domain-containing protein n=1 Tax=Paracrocinitomix mangrovi TaxID=2862509 RepID=UPI001C8D2A9C|nr:DUF389 domain-containing protein [Paracrocinitomix mangrovi]UKN02546.1 DUF389 domain-containing protein [Paracrocinitomix mangrovi]